MAKGTAHCHCRKCGAEFIREKVNCVNRKDANSWEEWAKKSYDLCTTCWQKQQKTKEIEDGLKAKARLESPYAYKGDELPGLVFVLYGDTYSVKDHLKDIGCVYTDDYPSEKDQFAGGLFAGLESGFNPQRWIMRCTLDDVSQSEEKLETLGFQVEKVDQLTLKMWVANIAYAKIQNEEKRKKKEEAEAKVAEALNKIGEIPAWPEVIREKWPNNAKWNQKVYGRKGAYKVYFDGNAVSITDEERELMLETLKKRQEWRKMKEEIEKSGGQC